MAIMAIMAMAILNSNMANCDIPLKSTQKLNQWWRVQLNRTYKLKVMIDFAMQVWKVTFLHSKNGTFSIIQKWKTQTFLLVSVFQNQRIQLSFWPSWAKLSLANGKGQLYFWLKIVLWTLKSMHTQNTKVHNSYW